MSEFEAEFQEDEIEIEAIGVEVNAQPIELYKVLKIADVVSGGGEAKYAITEGYVAVNGEIETRKRRKLYDGDLIEFNQEYYVVICDAPVTEVEPEKTKQKEVTKNSGKKAEKQSKNTKASVEVNKDNSPTDNTVESESSTKSRNSGRGEIKFF